MDSHYIIGWKCEAFRIRGPAAAWRACTRLACRTHDAFGDGDRRKHPPALRPFRGAHAPERSVLVSGAGQRHGHGLALLRNYDLGHGRPEKRIESAFGRTRSLCLRRAWQAIAHDSG